MTTFNEENEAETKASFNNALTKRVKSKKGPTTERAKYQVSKKYRKSSRKLSRRSKRRSIKRKSNKRGSRVRKWIKNKIL